MGKRFTATTKWQDKWFRRLDPKHKLLWIYLLDNCSNAGVWEVDLELAGYYTGFGYSLKETELIFEERIECFEDKWFIPKFIEFQYGELSVLCKPHIPVLKELERYGFKGYPKGIQRVKEKEKEKEQEKEKDNSRQVEVLNYFSAKEYPLSEAEEFFNHYESQGWVTGSGMPITNWRLKAENWHKEQIRKNLEKSNVKSNYGSTGATIEGLTNIAERRRRREEAEK